MNTEQPLRLTSGETPEILKPIDRHFAALMSDLAGETPEVKLAAALVSYQRRLGHICVDLDEYAINPPSPEIATELGLLSWPGAKQLIEKLGKSLVVGAPDKFKPLILDSERRLYLHRYWQYESELADCIKRLAAEEIPGLNQQLLQKGLAALFGKKEEIDWQAVAAFAAVRRRLCIISGGPGTGKTRTVVLLLALLLEQHPELRVALAAPTGKAAARLQESVKNTLTSLTCSEEVKTRVPSEAGTIHRLLGPIPDSAFFRHDKKNPLPYDAVVIDEASMVDLALMAKLVAAIPPSGRLILLGDKDQLASVEAGAVLADLCKGGEALTFSRGFVEEFQYVTGQKVPVAAEKEGTPVLGDCIVELRKNYRFGEQSQIHHLSRAINESKASRALEILQKPGNPSGSQVWWQPLPAQPSLKEALKKRVLCHYKNYLEVKDPAEALRVFGQFRILCALRNGPYGVTGLNQLVEKILEEEGLIRNRALHYAGRPVLVVRNDYNLKLFNGDIGVLVENETTGLRACFAGTDQALRDFLPLRLPEHQTAYAMTVHKSQGSEFEKVLLILPPEDSPVLTRELVYTGLTRASKGVELWCDPGIFTTSVERRIRRRSGLREALWQPSGTNQHAK